MAAILWFIAGFAAGEVFLVLFVYAWMSIKRE